MTQVEDQRSDSDRRAPTGERRRYNRRTSSSSELSPPYYEVFERIAMALEGIERAMTPPPEQVVLPPDPRSGHEERPKRG